MSTPRFPFPSLPAEQPAGPDFWNMLAKMGLKDQMPQPPAASPFSMSQEQVEASGGLGALAAARGKPQTGGGFGVLGSGMKKSPEVIWNADRTKWRYPASNSWRPASEQPK